MDRLSPEQRSENMRRIRSKNTSPEMFVRRMVHGMGYRYRLHAKDLPGKPDLVFRRLGKIIEVRGCFFHQHPGCIDAHIPKTRVSYWRPKLKGNVKRDAVNLEALRLQGWKVLVIWACEIEKDPKLGRRVGRFLAGRA